MCLLPNVVSEENVHSMFFSERNAGKIGYLSVILDENNVCTKTRLLITLFHFFTCFSCVKRLKPWGHWEHQQTLLGRDVPKANGVRKEHRHYPE